MQWWYSSSTMFLHCGIHWNHLWNQWEHLSYYLLYREFQLSRPLLIWRTSVIMTNWEQFVYYKQSHVIILLSASGSREEDSFSTRWHLSCHSRFPPRSSEKRSQLESRWSRWFSYLWTEWNRYAVGRYSSDFHNIKFVGKRSLKSSTTLLVIATHSTTRIQQPIRRDSIKRDWRDTIEVLHWLRHNLFGLWGLSIMLKLEPTEQVAWIECSAISVYIHGPGTPPKNGALYSLRSAASDTIALKKVHNETI